MPATTSGETGAVEVEIGGQKLMVAQDLANAIKAEQQMRAEQVNEFKQQTQQQFEDLKNQFVTQQRKEPEPTQDTGGGFWDDPDKYFDQREQKLLAQVDERLNKKDKENDEMDAQRLFWDSFYEENDFLNRKDDHFIATAILSRDWEELKKMRSSEAVKELGERTKTFLADKLELRNKKTKDKTILETPQVTLEPELEQQEKQPDPSEGSFHEIIKKRNADRRAARLNIRSSK